MKNQIRIVLFSLCLISTSFFNQTLAQKSISASRISTEIKVDGFLDEKVWTDQESIAQDFHTIRPKPGLSPAHPTEMKVVYDDDAIYISARMKEGGRDSIMCQLMERDQIGNTDFIGIMIDPYGNSNIAFEFILSSTGVQFDAKITPNGEDESWDAVWFGSVQLTETEWTAEIKIPYSAIRFPKQEEQNWNIVFFRKRAVNGELSSWTDFDPKLSNPWLTQMGKLEGVKDIKPPVRLSFSPYASVYGISVHDKERTPNRTLGSSYNLGLDLKYGINDAFTLDMTLIPDYGQVQSDDVVLNLSPFEQRFVERRPFFTEGLEIFNKGDIFYSRRVGDNQQLYNASKLSGRMKNGLGIGIFNAIASAKVDMVTDPETGAETKETRLPLTNYNIIVFDKDLKNNSTISLTNTNVNRRGVDFHNANVTAASFNLKNKAQRYGIQGTTAISQIIHKHEKNELGHSIRLGVTKIEGDLIGSLSYQDISKNYNANDLGYSIFPNSRVLNLEGTYRIFDGFAAFDQFQIFSNVSYARNVRPEAFSNIGANLGFSGQTTSQHSINFWTNFSPKSNDFYEPRVEDRFFKLPAYAAAGFWFGTDNRKKVRFQFYGNSTKYNNKGWLDYSIGTSENIRFSDKFGIFVDVSYSESNNAIGYTTHLNSEEVIFGKRNRNTISNVLGSNYTFNNKMGMNFRLRHYWSKVEYQSYYLLNKDGGLSNTAYNEFNNLSYNAFTIDLNFNWRFAPGSEINIVWKNNISGVDNDHTINYRELSYRSGIRSFNQFPQVNSLSVRVVYFLDYSTQIKPLFLDRSY